MSDTGFYAVYCLECHNPRWPRHSYIGFTVNPERRLRQHNGEISSGAHETSKKRPWKMIFCLHGFPSKTVALQFEWAWQNPERAQTLRDRVAASHAAAGTGRSRRGRAKMSVTEKMHVVHLLLGCPPFSQCQLRVLAFDRARFDALVAATRAHHADLPPLASARVEIEYGDWAALARYRLCSGDEDTPLALPEDGGVGCGLGAALCTICDYRLDSSDILLCTAPRCELRAHPRCLAEAFGDEEHLIPQNTLECLLCAEELAWPAVVHRSKEAARKRQLQEKVAMRKRLTDTRKRLREEERLFSQGAPPDAARPRVDNGAVAPPPPPPPSQAVPAWDDTLAAILTRYGTLEGR